MPETEAQWEAWLFRFVRRYPVYLHEDLMQEARLALLRAGELYTPGPAAFTSFAHHHVAGALRHYLRDKANTVRVPGYAHDRGVRVSCHSHLNESGEGDTLDVYEQAKFLDAATLSLEKQVCLAIQVQNALAPLSPKQREAVWMVGVEGRSFSEIGRLWGTKPGNARYQFDRAVRRMRGLLEKEGFHGLTPRPQPTKRAGKVDKK